MSVIVGPHHTGVRTFDVDESRAFYCGVLGLQPNPAKDNWLGVPGVDHQFVHLMPASGVDRPSGSARENARDGADHVALETHDLRAVVARLLEKGCRPFQTELDFSKRRDVTSADQPLDFGIGTVFVIDPAGNVVEFIQRDHGIFAKTPN